MRQPLTSGKNKKTYNKVNVSEYLKSQNHVKTEYYSNLLHPLPKK